MTRSIVRELVVKDLYLARWIVLGSIVAGVAAVAVMPLGKVTAYVGAVSFLCVLIILNIFLVMNGVVQEKKDKVVLFVLSLPVSTSQYIAAKVLANAIAFGVPWLVLTAAGVSVITASHIPNGILPFWVAVQAYLLLYYGALLAVGLVSDSTGWHATAITLGNVSVNFLIPGLLALPSIAQHRDGPVAVWTGDVVAIIAAEILLAAAAVGLGMYLHSRRTDFV